MASGTIQNDSYSAKIETEAENQKTRENILESEFEIWESNSEVRESEKKKTQESDKEIREKMKRYWDVYKPSLESMMLSHDAKYLAENEQNEILSYLPPYRDRKVLELGAGIGRFTTRLAQITGHLTAVDFMKSYIEENEKNNKHFGNVLFLCADVTKLVFPDESFDVVFSNWLLMYLSDTEVKKLMNSVLKWLKPNGFFFFRESCYHPSGNVARAENPTKYRTPIDYVKLLEKSSTGKLRYEMKFAKSVLTYVRSHGNPNQLVILAKQIENRKTEPGKCATDIQKFSEENEISSLKTQQEIGADEDNLRDIIGEKHILNNIGTKLALRSGQRVLSIGCGTGGVPRFLVKNFGVFVHGIDENITNIHLAIEGQGKLELDVRRKIQFEFTHLEEANLPNETYELSLCLSHEYHHRGSVSLISRSKEWLQPGGHFVFTALIKTNHDELDTKDFLSQKDLEGELSSSGFITKEMKSDRDMAIRWFKSATSVHEENKNEITRTIDLLNKQKLDWIQVIAMTSDANN